MLQQVRRPAVITHDLARSGVPTHAERLRPPAAFVEHMDYT
jgi:hypothetical protein